MKELRRSMQVSLALLLAAMLWSCATAPDPAMPETSEVSGADDAAVPRAVMVPAVAAGSAVFSADETLRTGFATRHAHFQPVDWAQIPGWREDDLDGALDAFRRSCVPLARREMWRGVCARVADTESGTAAMRSFFEREFEPYEVRNADRSREGVITGYYEPLIAGRSTREGAFVIPVYGLPSDLLTVDMRQMPKSQRNAEVPARIVGSRVVPVLDGTLAPYTLKFGDMHPGVLDKRIRVRVAGDRIEPYPSRAEIEREGLRHARVLAWVDNAAALYSMQIQGSGRIRLEDGRTLRLAYAEQNGHPFRPPLRVKTRGVGGSWIFARGLDIDFDAAVDDAEPGSTDSGQSPLTRGTSRSTAVADAEVERLVEALASGQVLGEVVGTTPPAAAHSRLPSAAQPSEALSMSADAVMRFPQPSAAMLAAISSDPSYVFFRPIPDGPEGPPGALGVPLTAGRSVAVDPRVTPLGAPIFISTTGPGGRGALNQLVMAQDTGGAIRGAVRADYFWGLGSNAFARAARMKERGHVWLLLPRGLELAVRDSMLRTRGSAPGMASECLVPDEEFCVEDIE